MTDCGELLTAILWMPIGWGIGLVLSIPIIRLLSLLIYKWDRYMHPYIPPPIPEIFKKMESLYSERNSSTISLSKEDYQEYLSSLTVMQRTVPLQFMDVAVVCE